MDDRKQMAYEAEFRVAAELTREGYKIAFPHGEYGPVDLYAHREDEVEKVQVKAIKPKNGNLKVKLESSNNWQTKKYSKDDIDIIVAYDYVNKKGYKLDFSKLKEKGLSSAIKLRIEPTKNNQKKKINWAEDYLFFE